MEQKREFMKFLRQKKLLLIALIALPVIAFVFWTLKEQKQKDVNSQSSGLKGFNMALPDAYLKEDKTLDKMSYYERAAIDSAKLKELKKNDPYYKEHVFSDENRLPGENILSPYENKRSLNTSLYGRGTNTDSNEAKVYRKLDLLNSELNKATASQETNNRSYPDRSPSSRNATVNSEDVERLEQMMNTMNQKDEPDPEIQQLNSMLEKIMDIQHPERVQEKVRKISEQRTGQVFTVSANGEQNVISLIDNSPSDKGKVNSNIRFSAQPNGFYSLNDDYASTNLQNALEAVIHETQTLVDGSTVKLRLINDVYVNGALIPKDNFLFGTASISGERLIIKINSIRYRNSLFPVALFVYDMDGLDGIYIPGAIGRDVAKQSAGRALQNIGFTGIDPSIGIQAANAGIEAAKSLVSKKVKLVKVTVKAGYKVLLHDEKQKHNN